MDQGEKAPTPHTPIPVASAAATLRTAKRSHLLDPTTNFQSLTPCRGRSPALSGTAGRCPIKGVQIKVWSGSKQELRLQSLCG